MKLDKIHEDKRGSISILTEGMIWPEVTIFITNAKKARGGCIHKRSDEYSTVIEGDVIYYIGDTVIALSQGQSIMIPKNTPHYFLSLTYSVVLEWGAQPDEKKDKHKKFRAIVERINEI